MQKDWESEEDQAALARQVLRLMKGTLKTKQDKKPVGKTSKSSEDFAIIAAVSEAIRSPVALVYMYLVANNVKNGRANWQDMLTKSATLYPPATEGASRLLQALNRSIEEPSHNSLYPLMNHHIATFFSNRNGFAVQTNPRGGGIIQYTNESPTELLDRKFFSKF